MVCFNFRSAAYCATAAALWSLSTFTRAPLASALSVSDAEEACAFKPAASQENHYGKTEFFQQKRVAEIVGGIVSGFYDVGEQKWDVSPRQLKSIVLHNLNAATGTKIYGSAIAFEPGVFTSTAGLEEGVPSKPATGAQIASGELFFRTEYPIL